MQFKRCSQCNSPMPLARKTCPKCGEVASVVDLAKKKKSNETLVIIVLSIVIFFCFIYVISATDLPPQKNNTIGSKSMAFVFCKDFVKLRLKSPNTAEFKPITSSSVAYLGGGTYLVVSSVRAQNSFGGFGLENYSCTVTSDKNSYSLDSLNMN